MAAFTDARVRPCNQHKPDAGAGYVLYWMQAYRRLNHNHALDHALRWSRQLKKPLVVYEGLRLDYPWASARHHRFMLEGMIANSLRAAKLGINYWPYVETPDQPARGLLRKLAEKACVVVTDDYPAFIVPPQIAALAAKTSTAVFAVDGNGIIPLAMYGDAVSACAHLRHRVHRLFPEAWNHRASPQPDFPKFSRTSISPPFTPCEPSSPDAIDKLIAGLPIDQKVQPVTGIEGGSNAAQAVLQFFLDDKLDRYGNDRNQPDDPARGAASGLSAYLRHGHISIEEIAEKVLNITGSWSVERINPSSRGKREGYYDSDPNISSFLDESLTWRDVGYHWHYCRNVRQSLWRNPIRKPPAWTYPAFQDLESTLPSWALKTLRDHQTDRRPYLYPLEVLEAGKTHDPLWNAAQRELLVTGRIHNYLRMLWGKKVLEWSATPQEAYFILEHLNNKYAIDGRDPNSYTGILWCFGCFDRPWAPERKIFGTVRYMSSDNTAKKFKLGNYLEYVNKLPNLAEH
jgi:deoxyribodipyrimidine photo-lyase